MLVNRGEGGAQTKPHRAVLKSHWSPAHQILFLLALGRDSVNKFSIYMLLTCTSGSIPAGLEANVDPLVGKEGPDGVGGAAGFGVSQTWVQIQSSHRVSVWPWASHRLPLSLRAVIHHVGSTASPLQLSQD